MSTATELIIIAILIALSSYFSGTEIAYTSVRAERIQEKYEKKKSLMLRHAVYFLSHYDDMLATILIGNNVTNIVSSSIATVVVIELLGDGYSWVATAAMTVLILVFGEVLPKSVGKSRSETICVLASTPLRVLSVVLHPAVVGVNFLIDKISKVWQGSIAADESISEEELSSVLDIVESEGVIEEAHTTLVKRAIDYKDIKAYEIITPRVDMEYIDINDSGDDIIDLALSSNHSRLPVCDRDADNIIGVLHINKLLFRLDSGEINDSGSVADCIRSLCLPPILIPRTTPLHTAVDLMRERQQQLVFVVDSYGGIMGILTMEDALEVIVGDIWDESDKVEPNMINIGEGIYDLSSQLRLRELFSELDIGHECDEIADEYTVLGGWCTAELGLEPDAGASFTYGPLTFTVRSVSDKMPERITLTISHENEQNKSSKQTEMT